MAFVNVQGEVSRLHNSGNGFGLKETWEVQGKQFTKYWAVFPKEQVQVQPGMTVKVSGGLQTKPTEPNAEGRVFVDHTVGQAKVEVVGQPVPQQAPVQSQPAQDGWANPGQSFQTAEAPF